MSHGGTDGVPLSTCKRRRRVRGAPRTTGAWRAALWRGSSPGLAPAWIVPCTSVPKQCQTAPSCDDSCHLFHGCSACLFHVCSNILHTSAVFQENKISKTIAPPQARAPSPTHPLRPAHALDASSSVPVHSFGLYRRSRWPAGPRSWPGGSPPPSLPPPPRARTDRCRCARSRRHRGTGGGPDP